MRVWNEHNTKILHALRTYVDFSNSTIIKM